jgi:circadian clock protein KaiB
MLMINDKTNTDNREFERALERSKREKYILRLYVTGLTQRSTKAITNVKGFCETYLKGRYELEVIDIYQQPHLAKGQQIIAAPTLIKKLPLPLRKLIGDMSDKEKFLVGIDLQPRKS